MAKLMRSRGIPYAISTSASIFDQPELLGLWYLVKWLGGQADDDAIAHVMLGPFIGWTAEQFRRLAQQAHEAAATIEDTLKLDASEASRLVAEKIEGWRRLAETMSASRLVFEIVFTSGVAERW